MGCDYYIGKFLCIKYKSDEKEEDIIRLERKVGYFWSDEPDLDFETQQEYLDRKVKDYPPKDLYRDGVWLCTDDAREKYINIIIKNGIDMKLENVAAI